LVKLKSDQFRDAHARLSGLLHEYPSLSLSLLIQFFLPRIESLTFQDLEKASLESGPTVGLEEFLDLTKKCLSFQPNGGVRVLTYRMPDIEPYHAEEVLPLIRVSLDRYAHEPLDAGQLSGDMVVIANWLGMSRKLVSNSNGIEDTYFQFEAILQRLSREGNYQLARDFSEEAMLCSLEDGVPHLGHYCRFTLFSAQRNPIDAALHACLLMASLDPKKSLSHRFYVHLLMAFFTFYRNVGFFELATPLYEKLVSSTEMAEYESQTLTMAFFNMLLLAEDPSILSRAEQYVRLKFDSITSFGVASLLPWFAMVCNLRVRYPTKYGSHPSLVNLEAYIDAHVRKNQLEALKDQIQKIRPNAKELLRVGLEQLTQSRNKNDHIYESNLLQVRATGVIEMSLENGDVEGILLGHLAKSDGSIAFDLAEHLPRYELLRFDHDVALRVGGRFKDYFDKTKQKLSAHPECRYVWLGFENERAYYLIYDSGRFVAYGYIPGVIRSSIRNWLLKQLPELGFDDSPRTRNPFESREDIWQEESEFIQKELPKISLPITDKTTILFNDVEISCFPHNFIFDSSDSAEPQDVCSPLSLDHYLSCKKDFIDISKINAWAPIVEQDYAIQLAFSRLKECTTNFSIHFSGGLYPEFDVNTDVKMFVCHGGRDKSGGFTGLYPSSTKKYLTPGILGTGKVAVLFVCHGGHIASDFYSRTFQTLAKTLLLAGYETVIASAWSLNINIPGPWANAFLLALAAGLPISRAVQNANAKIKEAYPVESAWAAMHVFGNPHLTVKQA